MESSSGGEMPTLLNAMSTRPSPSATSAYSCRTWSSLATSAAMNIPLVSAAAAFPAVSSISTATIFAPSAASRRTLARPMPLPAPVTTATRSCKRSIWILTPRLVPPHHGHRLAGRRRAPAAGLPCSACSVVGGDEHVLGLGEGVQRIWTELAAQARLLEPAERRPVADRRMRIHREVAALDGSCQPDRSYLKAPGASGPSSRPRPDSLNPPNGVQ